LLLDKATLQDAIRRRILAESASGQYDARRMGCFDPAHRRVFEGKAAGTPEAQTVTDDGYAAGLARAALLWNIDRPPGNEVFELPACDSCEKPEDG
jgi:hypothetical protein